jgi:SUMO ligase MMS21 Smc5/6 complex component
MEDFICVEADLSTMHSLQEATITNNRTCLLIEDGTFSVGPIAPNPIENIGEFTLILTESTTVTIQIFDAVGKRYLHSTQSYTEGAHVLTIEMKDWSAGTYFLEVGSGNQFKISQFIKI